MGKVEREMIEQLNLEYRYRQTGKTTELIAKTIQERLSEKYSQVIFLTPNLNYLRSILVPKFVEAFDSKGWVYKLVSRQEVWYIEGLHYDTRLSVDYLRGRSGKYLFILDEFELLDRKMLDALVRELEINPHIEAEIFGISSRVEGRSKFGYIRYEDYSI